MDSEGKTKGIRMKHIFLSGILLVVFACQPLDKDFSEARSLFDNFDKILSPQEYAKTYYFQRNLADIWLDENNQPVQMDIPFRDHFLSFGPSFVSTQSGGTGVNTQLINRYRRGRNTQRFYELDKLTINGTPFTKAIYIVWLDSTRTVYKAKLFDTKGALLQEATTSFIED